MFKPYPETTYPLFSPDCTYLINIIKIGDLILTHPLDSFLVFTFICFIIQPVKSILAYKYPTLSKILPTVLAHPLFSLQPVLVLTFKLWDWIKRCCGCSGETVEEQNELVFRPRSFQPQPKEELEFHKPALPLSDEPIKYSTTKRAQIADVNKYKENKEAASKYINDQLAKERKALNTFDGFSYDKNAKHSRRASADSHPGSSSSSSF